MEMSAQAPERAGLARALEQTALEQAALDLMEPEPAAA
jgi:hypothetical protein